MMHSRLGRGVPVLAQRRAQQRMRADLQAQRPLRDARAGLAEHHLAGVAVDLHTPSRHF